MAVGDDLQTVGVVHAVIGDEKSFGSDEDKHCGDTKRDPEDGFESSLARTVGEQGRRRHHSRLR